MLFMLLNDKAELYMVLVLKKVLEKKKVFLTPTQSAGSRQRFFSSFDSRVNAPLSSPFLIWEP
jgi:hypothetical protein